jgi:hypothetical protein
MRRQAVSPQGTFPFRDSWNSNLGSGEQVVLHQAGNHDLDDEPKPAEGAPGPSHLGTGDPTIVTIKSAPLRRVFFKLTGHFFAD